MTRSRQTADWGSRAGLAKIVPSSVAVGSGTGSATALGTVTFSGASSVSLNSVFSSTYDNYKILINITSNSTGFDPLHLRMRSGTTDNSSGNYKWHQRYFAYGGSGGDGTVTSYSSFAVGSIDAASSTGLKATVDLIGPFLTNNTSFFSLHTQFNYGFYETGIMTVTTSYDGFSLVPNSGNITGTVSVYGYTQ